MTHPFNDDSSQHTGVIRRMKAVITCVLLAMLPIAMTQAQPATGELGAMPSETEFPTVEFVFEERVTLASAVVIGETALGHRQYIPITGGTVRGPKLNGRVIPGGWDYQSRMAGGCLNMSADYFLEADDGTVIRILNESFTCGMSGGDGQRSFFRPRFEAPEDSAHAWLTRGTFVATLELDRGAAAEDVTPEPAIRIKVYQIK